MPGSVRQSQWHSKPRCDVVVFCVCNPPALFVTVEDEAAVLTWWSCTSASLYIWANLITTLLCPQWCMYVTTPMYWFPSEQAPTWVSARFVIVWLILFNNTLDMCVGSWTSQLKPKGITSSNKWDHHTYYEPSHWGARSGRPSFVAWFLWQMWIAWM